MKTWDYLPKESENCRLFEGPCPIYFVPSSVDKNTTPNALLVKKYASQYVQPVANKDIACTLMILENLAMPEWISIPCTRKILSDVVCIKENKVNRNEFTRFDQIKTDLEITSTIFQCSNGKIISSMTQCDGFKDCSGGEDEERCLCFVRVKQISDSYYCRYKCKKPECFCSELFLQSHIAGCFQYKPLIAVQNWLKNKILFTCPNETLRLEQKLVNDLIPDCKSNADENILFMMLTGNYEHNFTQISSKYNSKEQQHCFEGHSNLYHVSKECKYQVDQKGILQTCRNGKHLQNCSDFNCQKYFKFKCPKYYCIPMGYVCDHKIDCPGGSDENHCMNYSCIGLFHCLSSSQCIFVADVCDGIEDCMNGDDEFNCELHYSKCPKQCVCFGFAVSCNYSFQNVFNLDDVVQNRTYVSIIGNNMLWDFRCVQSCQTVQFLILTEFNLFDFCKSFIGSFQYQFHKVISIILSKNSIVILRIHCFQFDSSILSLNLSGNMISVIQKIAFIGLTHSKVLDLSHNKINSYQKLSFFQMVYVVYSMIQWDTQFIKFLQLFYLFCS